jgi:hypothetical protein
MHTVNAIPSILNYGERLSSSASTSGVSIGPTAHLQNIADEGYNMTVLQSDFAEYCTGVRFNACITYDSSSLRPTLELPLTFADRASLITLKFLTLSDLAGWLAAYWNVATASSRANGWNGPRFDPANDGRSSTVASFAAFDELTRRLRSARAGDAIFAHLLLPHYPYVVRADCTYLPWRSWKFRTRPADIRVRRRAYYEQVRCVHLKMAAALQALWQSPAGESSVIIIHGDHGSRITSIDPMEPNLSKFGDADMVAGFSTLFAVRALGVQGGYSSERLPAPALLRDFARSGFRSAPYPEPAAFPSVYLDDRSWRTTRRVNLPRSWLGISATAATQPRSH